MLTNFFHSSCCFQVKAFFKKAADEELVAYSLGRSASEAEAIAFRDRARTLLQSNGFLRDENKYTESWKEACYEMLVECHDICTASAESLRASGFGKVQEISATPPTRRRLKLTDGQFAFAVVKVSCIVLSLLSAMKSLAIRSEH